MGVGGVGVDDLEDPAAEDLQRLGVVVGGELEQVPFGLVDDFGVEVVGELGQGSEDGLGLLDVDPAVGERGTGQVAVLETRREPHGPVCAGRVVRVAWACQFAVEDAPALPARSMRSAWDSRRAFELGELGLGGLDLAMARWSRWVHRPDRDLRQSLS